MIQIQMSNQNMIGKDYNFHQSGTLSTSSRLSTHWQLLVRVPELWSRGCFSFRIITSSKHAAYELATIQKCI